MGDHTYTPCNGWLSTNKSTHGRRQSMARQNPFHRARRYTRLQQRVVFIDHRTSATHAHKPISFSNAGRIKPRNRPHDRTSSTTGSGGCSRRERRCTYFAAWREEHTIPRAKAHRPPTPLCAIHHGRSQYVTAFSHRSSASTSKPRRSA